MMTFMMYDWKVVINLINGYKQVVNLPDDYLLRIKVESVALSIGKLWWVSKFIPQNLPNHKVLRFWQWLPELK